MHLHKKRNDAKSNCLQQILVLTQFNLLGVKCVCMEQSLALIFVEQIQDPGIEYVWPSSISFQLDDVSMES